MLRFRKTLRKFPKALSLNPSPKGGGLVTDKRRLGGRARK